MKNCSCHNVRKHKDIRGSDKYVTLEISSKFDSLDKMKITSSESKVRLEISGKGLITSLSFKTKTRSKNTKRQGMPSEMSVRSTLIILLRILRKLRNYLMRRRGPNMRLMTSTFIYQGNFQSV